MKHANLLIVLLFVCVAVSVTETTDGDTGNGTPSASTPVLGQAAEVQKTDGTSHPAHDVVLPAVHKVGETKESVLRKDGKEAASGKAKSDESAAPSDSQAEAHPASSPEGASAPQLAQAAENGATTSENAANGHGNSADVPPPSESNEPEVIFDPFDESDADKPPEDPDDSEKGLIDPPLVVNLDGVDSPQQALMDIFSGQKSFIDKMQEMHQVAEAMTKTMLSGIDNFFNGGEQQQQSGVTQEVHIVDNPVTNERREVHIIRTPTSIQRREVRIIGGVNGDATKPDGVKNSDDDIDSRMSQFIQQNLSSGGQQHPRQQTVVIVDNTTGDGDERDESQQKYWNQVIKRIYVLLAVGVLTIVGICVVFFLAVFRRPHGTSTAAGGKGIDGVIASTQKTLSDDSSLADKKSKW